MQLFDNEKNFENARSAFNIEINKLINCLPDTSELLADIFYEMSLVCDNLHNYDSAVLLLNQSLTILKTKYPSGNKKVLDIHNALGIIYRFGLFDYQQAEMHFVTVYNALPQTDQFNHYDKLRLYYHLGTTYRLKQDFDQAKAFMQLVISSIPDSSNTKIKKLGVQAHIATANVLNSQEQFKDAIPYYISGIDQLKDLSGDHDVLLANAYNNLAVTYYSLKNFDSSRLYYEKAIRINRDLENTAALSNNLFGLGELFTSFDRYGEAKDAFDQCLKLRVKFYGDQHLQVAFVLRQLGIISHKQGFHNQALEQYQRALTHANIGFINKYIESNPTIQQLQKYPILYILLADKGDALFSKYVATSELTTLEKSINCYQMAIKLLHYNRRQFEEEGSHLFALDHYHYVFQDAIRGYYELWQNTRDEKWTDLAFRLMESSKSVILTESLQKVQLSESLSIPDSLLEQERELNKCLNSARNNLQSNHTHRLDSILNAKAQLKQVFQNHFPSYHQYKYRPLTQNLGTVRDKLDKDQMAVEFFRSDSSWYVIGISQEQTHFHRTPVTRDIARFRTLVERPPQFNDQQAQFNEFTIVSHNMYQQLLNPVLRVFPAETRDKIIIIPDGELAVIPFEALVVSDDLETLFDYVQLDYLIKHASISYGYSIQLYFDNLNEEVDIKKIFGMSFSGDQHQELKGAQNEVKMIASLYEGTFLYGNEANKTAFLQEAGSHDVIHLAVHGSASSTDVQQAWLQFSDAEDDQGLIYEEEIYALQIPAKLVVLSACETGLGPWQRGEGIYSLARAFTFAGVQSQVISLWKVDDQSTAQMMEYFYNGLNEYQNSSKALQEAKMRYLNTNANNAAHPYFWAALTTNNVLFIYRFENFLTIILLTFFAIIIIAYFYINKRKFNLST